MTLRLATFPVRYPNIWLPTTASLGPRGSRRISFVDNFGDGRGTSSHGAIDIFGDMGLSIVSATSGRIARYYFFRGTRYPGIGTGVSGTKFVVVIDGSGFMHYYAHLSGHFGGVRPGDRINAGQQLGWLGISGNGPDPHLHYQVHEPKREPGDRGTDGFATDEIDRVKVNPFTELSRVAKAQPAMWFEGRSLVEIDRGLHARYLNPSGNAIRPRIVINNGPLASGVAAQ